MFDFIKTRMPRMAVVMALSVLLPVSGNAQTKMRSVTCQSCRYPSFLSPSKKAG